MKKHTSEEALYERMRNLAQVNKTSIKESQNRTLGTLIDYERTADGVAYGIVKEQHHYYIKKGGLNENLNVADFAYIGGLQNITEFQYDKLSEAEKQRNMLLKTINEGISTKVSKTGSKKKMLTEDKAGQEIEMAANKVGELDAATDAAEVPAEPLDLPPAGGEGEAEMDAGLDAMASGDEEMAGDDAMAAAGDEEVAVEDPQSEEEREIEKMLGKITNTLRKTELTDSQVKSYVNTFLSAFKDKFPDIDIEDRKAMAEKITKVVPPEDIEDLGQNVEDTGGEPELEEEQCSECGGFAQYAESRGYDANSIKECGEEEMTNLISGYANGHDDGQNDGDFKAIALFITPEILEKLKSEYGHDEFANQVEPFSTEMNEASVEDRDAQINELFGGLKNLANTGAQKIKQGAKNVAKKVGDAATAVKQTYHAGEVPAEVKKLEGIAANLGQQIGVLNKRMEKAGKQPINVASILTTIKNQIASGGAANLAGYTNEDEGGIPVDSVEAQPMMEETTIEEDVTLKVGEKAGKKLSPNNVPEVEMKEEEKEGDVLDIDNLNVDDETEETHEEPDGDETGIVGGFQSLGGGVVKPDGAPTTVEVTKDSVNITMNETLKKIQETINSLINESKPSAGLTKKEKSNVVKKAKAGEDIGKKGKGFEKVADKAAKEYGSKEKGEKVAAAAMWKNIKKEGDEKEGEVISESERKLRKYIRNRLEEHAGLRKPSLNEDKKSEKLQKLDKMIEKQFNLFESDVKKKIKSVNEVFGFSIAEKFAKLDPNDSENVEKLFKNAFNEILINPRLGAIGRAASVTPTNIKYDILKQYVDNNGGTLRIGPDKQTVVYASKDLRDRGTSFVGGGNTRLGV